MSSTKLQKLDEIISNYIEKDKDIIDMQVSNLTNPGDNWGSQIYKVDLKLKTKTTESEELYLVAKQIPNSEYYQQVFNVQVTFNQEKEFYKTVVPTLHDFQRKMGTKILDAFPKFYGARNSLNCENGKVDKDGLIVVENLKIKGYKNLDRFVGFDLSTSRTILKTLAQFHAIPLAIKLKEPEVFEQKIKPHLSCFLPKLPKVNLSSETAELVKLLEESEECRHLTGVLEKSIEYFLLFPEIYREPFSTVVHRDFWVNNIMVNSKNDVKIVDFQMYTYDSPIVDLFFFLFTSVQTEVLKENLDNLLHFYHENFIQTLVDHKCQTEAFSYEKFLDEISACGKYEFGRVMFMLCLVVRGPKEFSLDQDNTSDTPKLNTKHLTTDDKDRVFWFAQECYRRGWLNF
ncbi:unnamed protein product [Psylliodes chrysocephalus]|uniref:CHK kinase-like domain-containing protein n=1 Tax=Psylliodes chrysocephalus TaxID=3402493 RepID=A0A9P0D7Q0_9CUCU|nr:unnamed protein product [Psylliodes chrysocephala]